MTARDQILAVAGHAGGRRRRHPGAERPGLPYGSLPTSRLRGQITKTRSEVGTLDQQSIDYYIPVEMTLETQAELERLGINPELVFAVGGAPAALPRQARRRPRLPRQSRPPRVAALSARPAATRAADAHPGRRFPPAPAPPPVPANDNRRWTDPAVAPGNHHRRSRQ